MSFLLTRRFCPFFLTQFLGACNDNIFRNALLIVIAFQGIPQQQASQLSALAGLIFTVPFLLFSSLAGQLADQSEKARLIRYIKFIEVLLMAAAAIAFIYQSLLTLMILLFFMSSQSTFFGPIKYSLIPHHLPEKNWLQANGWVQMGTFLAIVLGTNIGGLLIGSPTGRFSIGMVLIGLAVVGFIASCFIPKASAQSSQSALKFSIFAAFRTTYHLIRADHTLWWCILAISWFWGLGMTYLTHLPTFTKQALMGEQQMIAMLLTVFSVGVGLGSVICHYVSRPQRELRLVVIGGLALVVFGMQLALTTPSQQSMAIFSPAFSWIALDILGMGIAGGLYIVPLYTFLQRRSPAEHRAVIIAVNNVSNAIFMIALSLLAIGFLEFGTTIAQWFLVVSAATLIFSGLLVIRVKEIRQQLWQRSPSVKTH